MNANTSKTQMLTSTTVPKRRRYSRCSRSFSSWGSRLIMVRNGRCCLSERRGITQCKSDGRRVPVRFAELQLGDVIFERVHVHPRIRRNDPNIEADRQIFFNATQVRAAAGDIDTLNITARFLAVMRLPVRIVAEQPRTQVEHRREYRGAYRFVLFLAHQAVF